MSVVSRTMLMVILVKGMSTLVRVRHALYRTSLMSVVSQAVIMVILMKSASFLVKVCHTLYGISLMSVVGRTVYGRPPLLKTSLVLLLFFTTGHPDVLYIRD